EAKVESLQATLELMTEKMAILQERVSEERGFTDYEGLAGIDIPLDDYYAGGDDIGFSYDEKQPEVKLSSFEKETVTTLEDVLEDISHPAKKSPVSIQAETSSVQNDLVLSHTASKSYLIIPLILRLILPSIL
ncbi:hypothetical protein NGRA_3311, partial [Nosema granulosis]